MAYKNVEDFYAYRRKWRAKNKDKTAAQSARCKARGLAKDPNYYVKARLRLRYGITIEERDELFSRNDGLCWICSDKTSEVIDHDHASNKVRGALCRTCNTGIGLLREDKRILQSAIAYLSL